MVMLGPGLAGSSLVSRGRDNHRPRPRPPFRTVVSSRARRRTTRRARRPAAARPTLLPHHRRLQRPPARRTGSRPAGRRHRPRYRRRPSLRRLLPPPAARHRPAHPRLRCSIVNAALSGIGPSPASRPRHAAKHHVAKSRQAQKLPKKPNESIQGWRPPLQVSTGTNAGDGSLNCCHESGAVSLPRQLGRGAAAAGQTRQFRQRPTGTLRHCYRNPRQPDAGESAPASARRNAWARRSAMRVRASSAVSGPRNSRVAATRFARVA